jgi:hypothetical protein
MSCECQFQNLSGVESSTLFGTCGSTEWGKGLSNLPNSLGIRRRA